MNERQSSPAGASERIDKSVSIAAPREKVWAALTNAQQFGTWFRARLDGSFAVGETIRGQMTYPGYEHYPFEARVTAMDEPDYFAFEWPQFDPDVDYSAEPWTLVEFRLSDAPDGGTLLQISESGFENLSQPLRQKAFLGNSEGWQIQSENVRRFVEGGAG